MSNYTPIGQVDRSPHDIHLLYTVTSIRAKKTSSVRALADATLESLSLHFYLRIRNLKIITAWICAAARIDQLSASASLPSLGASPTTWLSY